MGWLKKMEANEESLKQNILVLLEEPMKGTGSGTPIRELSDNRKEVVALEEINENRQLNLERFCMSTRCAICTCNSVREEDNHQPANQQPTHYSDLADNHNDGSFGNLSVKYLISS